MKLAFVAAAVAVMLTSSLPANAVSTEATGAIRPFEIHVPDHDLYQGGGTYL